MVLLGFAIAGVGLGGDFCESLRAALTDVAAVAPVAMLGHLQGRVLLRETGGGKLRRVEAGHALALDAALISGDATRYEVRPTEGGGLWRVGRRAVFSLQAAGAARLWAGTAFVHVPAAAEWRVESRRSVVLLPEGSWLVQAGDNQGLKVVCLDGSAPLRGLGLPGTPSASSAATVKLRPGELAFLQPAVRRLVLR